MRMSTKFVTNKNNSFSFLKPPLCRNNGGFYCQTYKLLLYPKPV